MTWSSGTSPRHARTSYGCRTFPRREPPAGRAPTEHRTDEGKIYLYAIKDVYSNRIVGYSIDSRMKESLAVSALRNAIGQREIVGTILHSDRGSQFRSKAFEC